MILDEFPYLIESNEALSSKIHYCCFCRSGFFDDLQQAVANREDQSLFTPHDIVTVVAD